MTAEAASLTALDDLIAQVAEVAAVHASRTDEEAEFPAEALDALRKTRLLGLLVPERFGGLGGTTADMIRATLRLGRVDMSVAMIFAMHCQQVAALARHADEELRRRVLPAVAAGHEYIASVTTEAGKGGDLLTSGSELEAANNGLVLDRHAPIVTGGTHADAFLITMRGPAAQTGHEVSLVYARRDQLEIGESGDWQPLGMRATSSGAMHLRGVLPPEQVIGEHGKFRDIVSATFGPLAHLGWAAAWLGAASGALSAVIGVLRDPQARKRTDLNSELLLTRIAGVRHQLEAVHALLWHTAEVFDREPDLTRPRIQLLINGLKVTAADGCYAAADQLVLTVGLQHGYLRGSPTRLERVLRDLRSAALNYHNDRLMIADGKLALLDPDVRLA